MICGERCVYSTYTCAIESLRLEKGYRAWGADIGPDHTPLEAGLGWAVDWRSGKDFIGRDSLLAQREAPLSKRLVCFTLADLDRILLGRETIYRNDERVGWLSSAGWGYTVGANIGLGYVEKLGRIDILVNNAGIGPLARSEETSTELWDATMAVNLRGKFLYAREVGKQMIKQGRGRIVNLASQAALVALDGHLAYCASKAGLLGMTNVLAMEWGPLGITVNSISPTVVNTELGAGGYWAGEVGEAFKNKMPVGRFAEPEEIAFAALYLVSGAAGMINGENLVVDGGYTAT